jgi:hypothetical protein
VRNSPPAPLPPPGTALAKIYDNLAARARSGDAMAAMRLLMDLQRCSGRRNNVFMMNVLDDSLHTGHATGNETNAALKPILDGLDATDLLCAGITPEQIDRRGDWLRTAALNGDPEAMVCYAAWPNDFGPKFLSDAWFDWMQNWSKEAPEMAAQANAAGQADVVALFQEAYANNPITGQQNTMYPFGQLVQPDPILYVAYFDLYERLRPNSSGSARAAELAKELALTPAQIAQAQAFADAQWPRFAAHAGERNNVIPCRDGLMATQIQ